MTTKPSSSFKKLSAQAIESIRPLEPALPPAFPTFQEMVLEDAIAARTPATSRRLLDLFDGTLGDLAPLLADFNQYPEKYEAAQTQLLQRLESGSTSIEQLSQSERLVLNFAVLDYLTPPVVKPPAPEPPLAKQAAAERDEWDDSDAYKNEEPGTQPGESPETELPAHWWLQ